MSLYDYVCMVMGYAIVVETISFNGNEDDEDDDGDDS